VSTYEVLAQLMEDMLYPPTHRNPTSMRAVPNKGGTMT
jgi:hypothetical protein